MYPELPTPESANAVMNNWKSRFNDPIKGLADPLHLIITGSQDINMNVLLTSYASQEKGESRATFILMLLLENGKILLFVRKVKNNKVKE